MMHVTSYQGFSGFGFEDAHHRSVQIVNIDSVSGPGVLGSLGAGGVIGSSPGCVTIAPSSGGAPMKGWVNIAGL